MPIPVPSPSKIPRQSPTSSTPGKRPSSSSSSVGSSGRRHTSSPPTSRPASSSRYSPPQTTSRTPSNSSPSGTSRPSSKGSARNSPLGRPGAKSDENEDAIKMPPPPSGTTGRTMGLRNSANIVSGSGSGSGSGNGGNPRRSGRTQSISTTRPKTEEERLAPATAASKSLGNLLSMRPSVPSLKNSTSDPAKLGRMASARSRAATVDKASEKGGESSGGLGRAMSLRSKTAPGAGKVETTAATARTRAGAGNTVKQRPVSMYGATTNASKQDIPSTATATSGIRRPSTSSTSTTSMPPPPAPARGHRRSASNVTNATTTTTTNTTTASASTSTNANSRPATAGNTKPKRPAFSAHNQDYTTPANPNPPSPRSRIVPPPPLDTPTIHAQTQLLQLLTLHSSSAAVYQQLIASATATLKSRFEKLSARHYDARETSLKRQKRHNLDSLSAVVNNVVPGKKRRDTMKSPEERVQAFSESIKRIDAMRSGEFRKLCGVFGEWIAGYNPRSSSGGREKWVDGIGEAWRRECVGVCRRLEVSIIGVDGVVGVLAEHGEVEAVVTTVNRVAEGYKELAEGMLEEVEMMRRMEIEVVERERGELRRRVEAILEAGAVDAYSGQGIWAGC